MDFRNDDHIKFSNIEYSRHKYYFLFISELKAYGLGHFFKEALSKALFIPKEDIEFITIAPDVFEQYNYDNLIIIGQLDGVKENRRKMHDEFIYELSNSSYVDGVVDKILEHQEELFIYMFESSCTMTLDKKPRVKLIGPDCTIVSELGNKITLYELFSPLVPMAHYKVAEGYEQLLSSCEEFFTHYGPKVFISLERSAAGANSIIATCVEDIAAKFSTNLHDTFLVTEFIDHTLDPTTLGVVINEEQTYISGIADQRIEGTSFRGSTFPTQATPAIQEEIIRQTRMVGKKMAQMGYRGIFGCDFIVTQEGKVYFIETNPRKQGTTMEFCCALKTKLPKGAPNLPEIEFYAVTENTRPPRMKEPDFSHTDIYWGTYNVKMNTRLVTHSYLPQQRGEIEMFESVAKNRLTKEYMILEHIGQDFFVNDGSFLGRVIATGKSYKDVEQGIKMGKRMIEFTLHHMHEDEEEDRPQTQCEGCIYMKRIEEIKQLANI